MNESYSIFKDLSETTERKISVLVVEDDCVSLKLEASLLYQLDAEVITAENGQEGLMAFLAYYKEHQVYPDLMIVDLQMPKLNGYELIAAAKTYHPQQYTIVVSGQNDADSLVRLIDLGVNRFLFKPVQPKVFIESLRASIAQWREIQNSLVQEQTLQQQAIRFKLAVDGKGDGLWDWNIETNEVYFSSGWKRMLGFGEFEISGSLKEWESRVNPNHLKKVYEDIQAHLDGKTEFYENEHQVLCKDGHFKWILDRGVVVSRDPNRRPLRMIGTHTDIDDKKRFELQLKQQKREFEMIVNHNVDGIAIVDRETRFLLTNPAYQRMVGYSETELKALTCKQLTAPEDTDRIESLLEAVVTEGVVENYHKRCVVKNGRRIDVNISMALMPDGERFLLSVRDMTELKRQQVVIDEYLQMIDRNIITLALSNKAEITKVSQSFLERSGMQSSQVVGKALADLLVSARPALDLTLGLAALEGWRGELQLKNSRSQPFWLSAKITANVMNANTATHTMVCHDISDQKQLEVLSITDAMTGLFNRRHFETSYQRMTSSARRTSEVLLFILFDIDNFKKFNDTYGHQAGDDALIAVSKCLQLSFQRADDECFRVGGEELAVLAKSNSVSNALAHAAIVRQAIQELNIAHAKNPPHGVVTASMGVVLLKDAGLTLNLEQAYSAADELLYQAKHKGRNRLGHRILSRNSKVNEA